MNYYHDAGHYVYQRFYISMVCYVTATLSQWEPLKVDAPWAKDIKEKQWEEALQADQKCSLNVNRKRMQQFILLSVYYTPSKLFKMGVLQDPCCTNCHRYLRDLVLLLW